jgi:hypothetical protein
LWTFEAKMKEARLGWARDTRAGTYTFHSEADKDTAERLMYNCLSGHYLNKIVPLAPELRKFVAHLFV